MNVALTFAVSVFGICGAARAQAPLYDLSSGTAGERFGSSVTGLGDVDGDGYGDIAVGALHATGLQSDSGAVRIYSGKTGAFLRQLDGERTGDLFGFSIAGIGDVNGDGRGDLIVGAPQHSWFGGTNRGAVYVYSGATGTQLIKLGGSNDGDKLGWAVAGVPDVNGDGVPDYAFSEPWGDSGSITDVGLVWIDSGANHTFLRVYVGEAAGDHFGYSIAGLRDVNNDGAGDLVIGAPQHDSLSLTDSGRGYVQSGGVNGGPPLTSFNGATAYGWFGYSCAGLPDVTGDGRPEAMFGEIFSSVGGSGSGRIRAYNTINGFVVRDIWGAPGDGLGAAIAGLKDFDGDGYGDIIAGVPSAEVGSYIDAGVARVYSGRTGALLAQMTGYGNSEGFGASVADAGDINADGISDAIAGSPSYDQVANNAGRARVILGDAPLPTNYCTSKVNSQGCTPTIGYAGCASTTVGDLHIIGVNVLPNVTGIMIWSTAQTALPFYGGTLCIGSPVHRTPVQTAIDVVGSTYACHGLYDFEFTHANMAAAGLSAGMNLFAQYWSRDNGFAPPNNIGLTHGVKIPILP